MDGIRRANRPLGCILYRYWGTKKGHNPIAGKLINSAFLVMHFVNQNFVNLIHDSVSFLRAEFFGKLSKSFHIAKHYRHLLSLAFDTILFR
jgi:hypothetical protein